MTNEQKAIMAFYEMIEEQEKQKREVLKGIPDLTPEQQALFKIVIEQIVKESMDEGIKAAVAMIRISPSEMPLAELANRIEAVVED